MDEHLHSLDGACRALAHLAIRAYQLTLSSVFGRHCRHLPTCSAYVDEAIQRHGLWAGGWMGAARLCRCRPWGTSGFDPVPQALPLEARPLVPWRYGRWRGPLVCECFDDRPRPAAKDASFARRALRDSGADHEPAINSTANE